MTDEAAVREQWATLNRRAEARGEWATVEHYPAGDTSELALRLHREGLIYRINREVLHPLGLALGVAGKVDRATKLAESVYALTLHDTGGEPLEYSAEQIARGERKLSEAAG